MKLKECVRARARRASYVPYRQSKLTHLLRASFVESGGDRVAAQTAIIATVSPSSKDTEHSINTLTHACIMDGQADAPVAADSKGSAPEGTCVLLVLKALCVYMCMYVCMYVACVCVYVLIFVCMCLCIY
jgi:hypothetical protein